MYTSNLSFESVAMDGKTMALILLNILIKRWNWGHSLKIACLPSICKSLGSIITIYICVHSHTLKRKQ